MAELMDLIDKIKKESEEYMKRNHFCGHDLSHVLRVHKLCEFIGRPESADMSILEAAALLHDLGRTAEKLDPKIDHAEISAKIAEGILKKVSFPEEKIDNVLYAIRTHRFSKGIMPLTLEAKILQDADRIDISGALGIAMTFSFGGAHNRELYNINDPFAEKRELDDKKYCLDHFFGKLINLTDNMHTEAGKKIAEERQKFIRSYLEQFKREILFGNDTNIAKNN